MAERYRATRVTLVLVVGLLSVVAAASFAGAVGCGGGTPEIGSPTGRPSREVASSPYGAVAYATATVFASSIHPRSADSWGEIRAREFVIGTFQQYDYTPNLQEFIATTGGSRVHSANVVAVKEGVSAERLVVGAHYDAAGGEGYADNATGVALLLELAARLRDKETPYTLVFVAFGADDREQLGSHYFAESMSDLELGATRGMINLDGVAGGDGLYAFSRPGAPTWLRDDILAAAVELDVALGSPPARGGAAAGTATLATADRAFAAAGVPAAAVTASNWDAGRGNGAVQTAEHGRIWDTNRDTVKFIDASYPGRVQAQLADLTRVLEQVLTSKLEKRA